MYHKGVTKVCHAYHRRCIIEGVSMLFVCSQRGLIPHIVRRSAWLDPAAALGDAWLDPAAAWGDVHGLRIRKVQVSLSSLPSNSCRNRRCHRDYHRLNFALWLSAAGSNCCMEAQPFTKARAGFPSANSFCFGSWFSAILSDWSMYSVNQKRKLQGNGVHLAVYAIWVAYCFSHLVQRQGRILQEGSFRCVLVTFVAECEL